MFRDTGGEILSEIRFLSAANLELATSSPGTSAAPAGHRRVHITKVLHSRSRYSVSSPFAPYTKDPLMPGGSSWS